MTEEAWNVVDDETRVEVVMSEGERQALETLVDWTVAATSPEGDDGERALQRLTRALDHIRAAAPRNARRFSDHDKTVAENMRAKAKVEDLEFKLSDAARKIEERDETIGTLVAQIAELEAAVEAKPDDALQLRVEDLEAKVANILANNPFIPR
jgi:hypothetical protein